MAAKTYGPRERMVFSAAQLIRRDGVAATGLRDVVAHANAPRGSLQHYFPGGKDQLVGEAIAWGGRYARRRVERMVAAMRTPTPSKLFSAMIQQWIDDYQANGFAAGCPIAAATVDCADTVESTRQAAAAAFRDWRTPVAAMLTDMGVPARRASALAVLMISTLEGAVLMARAEQDIAPLRTAARELGPLLDGAIRA
jgi:AcrR family transcriptional regulator